MDDILDFTPLAPTDMEAFHRERDKILAAVNDRIARETALSSVASDPDRRRLAGECAKIFSENLYVCGKYGLPDALTDYLDWLRKFLHTREFPDRFLPVLFSAFRAAVLAFVDPPSADALARVFLTLRRREAAFAGGAEQ